MLLYTLTWAAAPVLMSSFLFLFEKQQNKLKPWSICIVVTKGDHWGKRAGGELLVGGRGCRGFYVWGSLEKSWSESDAHSLFECWGLEAAGCVWVFYEWWAASCCICLAGGGFSSRAGAAAVAGRGKLFWERKGGWVTGKPALCLSHTLEFS